MSKPITPQEAKEFYNDNFPSFVIEAVNSLIRTNYRPTSQSFNLKVSVVKSAIVNAVSNYNDEHGSSIMFQDYYLDFENIYKRFGWKVSFDRAGYNESYESFYTFEVATN